MTAKLYLFLHVPESPAQALLRLRAELRASAVAVLEGSTPLERVCGVNWRAARMGVRAGMTRAELNSFDGLILLRQSAEVERAAEAAVIEVAGALTPRTEDHPSGPHAAKEAYVTLSDVSGTERTWNSVERSAYRLRPPKPIEWQGEGESAFWVGGVLYEVRDRYGPWRSNGAWWTGQAWSHEEWDITVEAGGGVHLLCVLTHDHLEDRWHMDAIYD